MPGVHGQRGLRATLRALWCPRSGMPRQGQGFRTVKRITGPNTGLNIFMEGVLEKGLGRQKAAQLWQLKEKAIRGDFSGAGLV